MWVPHKIEVGTMFGRLSNVFRDLDPDVPGGGGSSEAEKASQGKKYAGKFEDEKSLEDGYKNLETAFGRERAEKARLAAELESIKESSNCSKTEESLTSAVKQAEAALKEFDKETDWDNLDKRELAKATHQKIKLEQAVEDAKEAHQKTKGKADEHSIRQKVFDKLNEADSARAIKVANENKIDIDQLQTFYNDGDYATYSEAAYAYLYKQAAKELKRLQKLEADQTAGREHNEPKDPPAKGPIGKDGKPLTDKEIAARIEALPTTKAFRAYQNSR